MNRKLSQSKTSPDQNVLKEESPSKKDSPGKPSATKQRKCKGQDDQDIDWKIFDDPQESIKKRDAIDQ